MKNASELPLVDELLDHGDGGHAPVVVPDGVRHARRFDGGDHRLGFSGGAPERLLAHDHLPGARRCDRDLPVRVIGAGDVDHVDVLAIDQLPPVVLVRLVPPVRGERLHAILVARSNRLEDRLEGQVEESRRLQERV